MTVMTEMDALIEGLLAITAWLIGFCLIRSRPYVGIQRHTWEASATDDKHPSESHQAESEYHCEGLQGPIALALFWTSVA